MVGLALGLARALILRLGLAGPDRFSQALGVLAILYLPAPALGTKRVSRSGRHRQQLAMALAGAVEIGGQGQPAASRG